MKTLIDQTTFGDGADGTEPGNCFAACLASLLGVPLAAVPNFALAGEEGWWRELQAWLSPRGWYALDMKWGGIDEEVPAGVWSSGYVAPGSLLIASGAAARGLRHCVLVRAAEDGPETLHDPHPSRAGLLRITHLTVLVPLDPAMGSDGQPALLA